MRSVQKGIVICLAGVGLCVWISIAGEAGETSTTRSRRPASGWATKKDQDGDLHAAIQNKLKRVLANQQAILQKAETIKQELEVIQARTSSASRHTFLSTGDACPACACP